MMKKNSILILVCLMSSISLLAQQADPVLMTVAGKDVTRSEFEYFFNKNNESGEQSNSKSVEDYVDLFVNYKLKVQAAIDAKFDTLTSFNKEFRTYRDAQLRPYLSDPEFEDSIGHVVYNNIKEQIGDSDLLLLSHILLLVPQKASEAVQNQKKERIDSIYKALQAGADFAELAKKYSEDPGSAQKGGELPWIGPKQTLPEFEKEAYALQVGKMSKPFLSTVGYHIVLMKERKKFESYEEKKPEIMKMLNSRGLKDMAAEHKIKKLVAESNGKLDREDVIQKVLNEAYKSDPSLPFLIEEYHDGLLLYEVSNTLVWQKAAKDEAGLQKFFKKNKSHYKWDAPRFKGYVVHARSNAMLEQARNFLKSKEGEEGIAAFNKEISKDSLKSVRIRYGIFKSGEDANVDHEKFSKNAPKPNKYYPYVAVVGKMLASPKSYLDDKAQVTSDYQDFKEKEWVEELRKKYSYTVNKDVLATVNQHK